MNKCLALISLLIASTSMATTVYLKPGECLTSGLNRICGVSAVQNDIRGRHHVYRDQSPKEDVKVFITCELTSNKSPNTWDMLVNIIGVRKERRTVIKSYAHFDQEACERDAESKNLNNK